MTAVLMSCSGRAVTCHLFSWFECFLALISSVAGFEFPVGRAWIMKFAHAGKK